MIKKEKVAIVACSNGLAAKQKEKIEQLIDILMGIDMIPILSKCIFAKNSVFNGTGEERAENLMECYKNPEIKKIFDVSGGDLANEVLSYLDYELIKKSEKQFWGYSDLTTVINAIYTKTGKPSVLYQIRNLLHDVSEEKMKELFDFKYKFIQGTEMKGILVGGNIRCLLKLAGTEYWPDMDGKILLLEAMSGNVPKMVTALNQLKQMGVFEKVNGILLGTFTEMETEHYSPTIEELVIRYVGPSIPIAKTFEIGHGINSKAVEIGKELYLYGGQR